MSTHNAMSLPMGSLIDRKYRLEAVLGQGGFGITYYAIDFKLNRAVAIKECLPVDFAWREGVTVIPRSESVQSDFHWAKERFIEEAQILAKFNHPAIIRVLYDFFCKSRLNKYLYIHYETQDKTNRR